MGSFFPLKKNNNMFWRLKSNLHTPDSKLRLMVWFGVSAHPAETGPLAAQRKDSNNIIFLQKIFYYSNIFSSYVLVCGFRNS